MGSSRAAVHNHQGWSAADHLVINQRAMTIDEAFRDRKLIWNWHLGRGKNRHDRNQNNSWDLAHGGMLTQQFCSNSEIDHLTRLANNGRHGESDWAAHSDNRVHGLRSGNSRWLCTMDSSPECADGYTS